MLTVCFLSLVDWTRQVVTLVQNEDFYPHPIRRELKPILDLFTEKNLGHIRGQDGAVNITDMAGWLSDYYRQVVQCPLQRLRTVPKEPARTSKAPSSLVIYGIRAPIMDPF